MPRVFAFTGTPGTGVQESLRRFGEFLNAKGVTFEYVCLDKYVWEAFVDEFQTGDQERILQNLDFRRSEVAKNQSPNWFKLLSLPADKIREYWSIAAKRAINEIQQSTCEYFFVSFHANYYSDNYRWRFCAVDFSLLKNFGFEAFFVLIDEIYEILERRKDLRENVYAVAREKKDNKLERIEVLIKKTIEYLDTYVLWRQEEIAQTDLLAYSCRYSKEGSDVRNFIPSHIFSVKHPISTLFRLIENPRFSVYLSHPITDIRAQGEFPNNIDTREIADISGEIRDLIPLIEPTTIDELRFKNIEYKRYFAVLNPRWPLLDEPTELLLPGCDATTFCDIAAELGVAEEYQLLTATTELEGELKGLQDRISDAVSELCEKIRNDITWRDYHLVDQTRRLVVFRPSFNGRPSVGVKYEVAYYRRVRAVSRGQDNIQVIIYHPQEDQLEARNRLSNSILDALASAKGEVGESLDKDLIERHRGAMAERIADLLKGVDSPQTASIEIVEIVDGAVKFRPTTPLSGVPLMYGQTAQINNQTESIKKTAAGLVNDLIRNDFYIAFLNDDDGTLTTVNDGSKSKLFEAVKILQ